MHQDYRIALIRDLRDQQVRYAPRTKRLEQADRAERLLSELDAKRQYPYEFIYYRVTDYRPSESVRRSSSGCGSCSTRPNRRPVCNSCSIGSGRAVW